MRVHAINAFEGDCLLLESDAAPPRFALIDGGPAATFDQHLQRYLGATIGTAGTLDVVMVTHVDTDHISGVLDLMADVERGRIDGDTQMLTISDVWHNSFGATIDDAKGTVQSQLHAMMSQAGRARVAAPNGAIALLGISHGARLRRVAAKLGLRLNAAFGGKLISQEQQAAARWNFGTAVFQVIGPTQKNLDDLRKEWIAWIEKHLDTFATGDVNAMANADRTIPNLSSIVLYGATPTGGVLLTGDARGDHILQGLEQSGVISQGGSLSLRLLKMQHHGSIRNVTQKFFDRLPADIYLISANGKHDNPDIATLRMLVESAHTAGRKPLIIVTNDTPSVTQLLRDRPPAQWGYRLQVRDPARDSIVIDLATGTAR